MTETILLKNLFDVFVAHVPSTNMEDRLLNGLKSILHRPSLSPEDESLCPYLSSLSFTEVVFIALSLLLLEANPINLWLCVPENLISIITTAQRHGFFVFYVFRTNKCLSACPCYTDKRVTSGLKDQRLLQDAAFESISVLVSEPLMSNGIVWCFAISVWACVWCVWSVL